MYMLYTWYAFFDKTFSDFYKKALYQKKNKSKKGLKESYCNFFQTNLFYQKKASYQKKQRMKNNFFSSKKSIPSDIDYSPMDYTIVRAGHFTTILV